MEQICELCDGSLRYYSMSGDRPSDQEHYKLFHQPCSYCATTALQPNTLCHFCQHLRLRHEVKCLETETRRKYLFPLRRGPMEDSDPLVNDCLLCRFVRHMIAVGLNAEQLSELEAAEKEHFIFLHLGLFEGNVPEGISALPGDIQIGLPDSSLWVGELHINDIENMSTVSHVPEMISPNALMDGINSCFETHPECQQDARARLPPGFRVIDVHRRCLIEKGNCRFVALSYVWGLAPTLLPLAALRSTVDGMMKDGGLPASQIPQTIEDAIQVCIRMGEQYLWADRLCIIQDDPVDQRHQIEAMKEMYSSAQLVLVAMHGNSMEFGILGISLPRKETQKSEDILGLRITNVVRELDDDPLDVWDGRGWTYQEAVLSTRRLYFTNRRAFFECERGVYHEDQLNLERTRDELISTRLILPEDNGSRFQSFVRHVAHYTPRKLSYRSDTYKALHGVLKSLYPGGLDAFRSGLPLVDFDRALLWFAETGSGAIERHEGKKGETIPTWSWASAMGLDERVEYQEKKFYGTLVPWFYIDDTSDPEIYSSSIAPCNAHMDPEPDIEWQVYMAIAINERQVKRVCFMKAIPRLQYCRNDHSRASAGHS